LTLNKKFVKKRLKELGKDVKWLAEKCFVKEQTVRVWLCEHSNPKRERTPKGATFVLMWKALECDWKEFRGFKND
jgi:hypothetical protein